MAAEAGSLLIGIPDTIDGEFVENILNHKSVRIERIVSRDYHSPAGSWYDQKENELVVLIAGSAAVSFEGDAEPLTMRPGDYVNIPAHDRHRVEWTEADADTVWLAIFY